MFKTTLHYHSQENVVRITKELTLEQNPGDGGEGREASYMDCGFALFLARRAHDVRALSKGLLVPLLELQQ